MTKAELIEKIAKDADIPKSTAKVAFESALDGIKTGLKKKNSKVTLIGFGTLKMFIAKLGWAVILRLEKRLKSKGGMSLRSNRVKTFLSNIPF